MTYAWGGAPARGSLKVTPEDFIVREQLGFELAGTGEHQCLQIRKVGQNTAWVSEHLARYAGVRPFDVSYCGRKDRHADTTQWFSVWLPGQPADWSDFELEGTEILSVSLHDRKLRKGSHWGNEFVITLRNLEGDSEALKAVLQRISEQGFPNYFGSQRFGREGQNIVMGEKLVRGERVPRNQRDMYLSALRSEMFNRCLSDQLSQGNLTPAERGWLYGSARKETPALEQIAARWPAWCDFLTRMKMKAQLRDQMVVPRDLSWSLGEDTLTLSFALPAGCYATSLIREIVDFGES